MVVDEYGVFTTELIFLSSQQRVAMVIEPCTIVCFRCVTNVYLVSNDFQYVVHTACFLYFLSCVCSFVRSFVKASGIAMVHE